MYLIRSICRRLLAFVVDSHLPGNSLAEVHLRRLPHVRHGGVHQVRPGLHQCVQSDSCRDRHHQDV
ncbi:unnamed protein product, partial [Ectocarpus sp. 12 AP-2014]